VQLLYRLRTSQLTLPWQGPVTVPFVADRGAFVLELGPFQEGLTGFYLTYVDVQVTVTDPAGNTPGKPTSAPQLIEIRDCSYG
jgi:hypothetical protein